MRIPGPSDLIKLTAQGYEAIERAIALVPRLLVLVSDVEAVMKRVQTVVTEIEDTQHRATVVVNRTETVAERSAAVVERAEQLTRRLEPLLNRFEPTLTKLEPLLARIAETTSPQEVDALVRLIDSLPEVVDTLHDHILPVLDTLGTVAPDLRDLLDASKELNELIGSVPGLGKVKKKIDETQEIQDDYRAGEEPAAAPERLGVRSDTGTPPNPA
jgi:hypothetical protein